jgi:uncharacterized protein DUF5681
MVLIDFLASCTRSAYPTISRCTRATSFCSLPRNICSSAIRFSISCIEQRNVGTVLKDTLDERITIREGKRTRSVSKLDAIILRLVNDAASGNAKAQSNLITLMRSHGLIEPPQEATNTEPFTSDDLAIIADFLGRHGNQAEPTQPPESNEKAETGEVEPPSKETKETKS